MPDMSMCNNKTCRWRKRCYRFMATPDDVQQLYADFRVPKGHHKCKHFMSTGQWVERKVAK